MGWDAHQRLGLEDPWDALLIVHHEEHGVEVEKRGAGKRVVSFQLPEHQSMDQTCDDVAVLQRVSAQREGVDEREEEGTHDGSANLSPLIPDRKPVSLHEDPGHAKIKIICVTATPMASILLRVLSSPILLQVECQDLSDDLRGVVDTLKL
jgi:hypothetical protein